MPAAHQISGRLSMQQLGLNIYSWQLRKESARICRRQGLRIAMALALPSAGACRTGPSSGRPTDRRPHRRGRAVGTPAGTIRMPPVSRSGSRAADGHQSRIIQRARTRQAHARECRGGTGCRSPGRRPMRPPGSPIFLFRYHAERRGRAEENARDPPFCIEVFPARRSPANVT